MIPKTLWQIGPYEYNELPSYIKMCTESWLDSNPLWTYRYMTNDDAYTFIKNNFNDRYAELYLKAKIPMCQADFWRYLVLYKFGGVYVDLDMLSMSPIEEWFNVDAELSLFKSFKDPSDPGVETYDQWMIGASPESLAMLRVVEAVANEIELAEDGRVSYNETGSKVFTQAINQTGQDVFINNDPPDTVVHYSGSRLWSEGYEGSNTSVIYPWKNNKNIDIRMIHNAYNSTDGK